VKGLSNVSVYFGSNALLYNHSWIGSTSYYSTSGSSLILYLTVYDIILCEVLLIEGLKGHFNSYS